MVDRDLVSLPPDFGRAALLFVAQDKKEGRQRGAGPLKNHKIIAPSSTLFNA